MLIDVDQMFQCDTCFHHLGGGCSAGWCDSGENYRPAVQKFIPIDAVPVVRCKDCMYFLGKNWCILNSRYDIQSGQTNEFSENDYCAKGIRR